MPRKQGLSPVKPDVNTSPLVPVLAVQLRKNIENFGCGLKLLLLEPSRSQDEEFLNEMKQAILALAAISKQINGE